MPCWWAASSASAGYLTLALAGGFPLFLFGAVLTGMGGALFSPALESLVGRAEERRRSTSGKAPGLFALLAICGEIGAVAGPLAGALLLGLSFSWAALAGAAVFAVMTGVLWHGIPAGAVKPAPANLDAAHLDSAHSGSANPLAAAAQSDGGPQGDTASQGNGEPQGAGSMPG